MPSDTRYSDAEVEAWVAEKYPMRGHRTGEMLRALLADRRRAEAELDIHRRAVDEAEAMIARLDGDRTDLKNIMREQGRIHDHVVSVLKADIAALLDIVRIARDAVEAGAVDEVYLSLLRDKIAEVDARLGAEVAG